MTNQHIGGAAVALFPRGLNGAKSRSAAGFSPEASPVFDAHVRIHTTILIGVMGGAAASAHQPEVACDDVTQAWTLFRFVPWVRETHVANQNAGSEAQV